MTLSKLFYLSRLHFPCEENQRIRAKLGRPCSSDILHSLLPAVFLHSLPAMLGHWMAKWNVNTISRMVPRHYQTQQDQRWALSLSLSTFPVLRCECLHYVLCPRQQRDHHLRFLRSPLPPTSSPLNWWVSPSSCLLILSSFHHNCCCSSSGSCHFSWPTATHS